MEHDVDGAVKPLRRAKVIAADHPGETASVEELMRQIKASGALKTDL
jgi:hypothetical protein